MEKTEKDMDKDMEERMRTEEGTRRAAMELHMGPMQGYADGVWRMAHRELYGGVDRYYTPFARMEGGAPRRQDLARLAEAREEGELCVPQIIFGSAEEFAALTAAVKALGWRRVDLNLGCPYAMQTKKGRGAAMIANRATMERVCELMAGDAETRYSVKTRLGMDDAGEIRGLLEVLNGVRLEHVTVHGRVARQMYKGSADAAAMEEALRLGANPTIWNGDVREPGDCARIAERWPGLKGIMAGRGLLARPSLGAEWKSGAEWDRAKRVERLLEIHARLLEEYGRRLSGETQLVQKMKTFWDYLEWETGHKTHKAIKKAGTLRKYEDAVGSIE